MRITVIPRGLIKHARFLAVLDTMWGEWGEAPSWFAINPRNWSGRRLYRLTSSRFPEVWVTNVCAEQVDKPSGRGIPDPTWLRKNLEELPGTVQRLPLLVCGSRVIPVYHHCDYTHPGPVHFLKHPAARTWTAAEIEDVQRRLQCT